MAKTAETLALEKAIIVETNKQGIFGCPEVTIGWYGEERVDYLTYDTKGIWRCYEIKVSKSDFKSKAHNTFCGHYNYYVMPNDLYEEVRAEISEHIGVYAWFGKSVRLVKRPKRQQLSVDEQILKNSLIRSLSRQADKLAKSENPDFVERMNRAVERERREKEKYRDMYYEANRRFYELKNQKIEVESSL